MKRKLLLFFALAVAGLSLMLGGEKISARLFAAPKAPAEAPQIPDYVLYESLFRVDLSFRQKAKIQRLTGQPVTSLEHYFKAKAGLTDVEDEILRQTSLEYLQEMQPINDQATQILADMRTQFQMANYRTVSRFLHRQRR